GRCAKDRKWRRQGNRRGPSHLGARVTIPPNRWPIVPTSREGLMIQRYDLVIVGGSFAGLACARTAALRGLKVAVIDGKPEPGARVRTTGIVVKEASDDFDLPSRLMRKVRGVRLYAPNDRSLDLSAPGYFFQATDTPGVLRWMASEAERAGATLLYDRKLDAGIEH